MSVVQKFLEDNRTVLRLGTGLEFVEPRPRFVCKDGWSVSIQASEYSYSIPRDNVGPYLQVELGFPSAPEPDIYAWRELGSPGKYTEAVYPYVPISQVEHIIRKHGGHIDSACEEETPLVRSEKIDKMLIQRVIEKE